MPILRNDGGVFIFEKSPSERTDDIVKAFKEIHSGVTEIHLKDFASSKASVINVLREKTQLPGLQHLRLENTTAELFEGVDTQTTRDHLRSLCIANHTAKAGDDSVVSFVKKFEKLQKLELRSIDITHGRGEQAIADYAHKLAAAILTRKELDSLTVVDMDGVYKQILSSKPPVTTLELADHPLTLEYEELLGFLKKRGPVLTRLQLRGTLLSGEKLKNLLGLCPNLTALDISRSAFKNASEFASVLDTIASLNKLQDLNLSGNMFPEYPVVNKVLHKASGGAALVSVGGVPAMFIKSWLPEVLQSWIPTLSALPYPVLSTALYFGPRVVLAGGASHLTGRYLRRMDKFYTAFQAAVERVRVLNISGCGIDMMTMYTYILPTRGISTEIHSLDISDNPVFRNPFQIPLLGIAYAVCNGLAHLPKLDSLRMQNVQAGSDSLFALSQVFQILQLRGYAPFQALTTFDVSHNPMSSGRAISLLSALRAVRTLKTMRIADCGVDFSDAGDVPSLMENLIRLDLSGNDVSPSFARSLARHVNECHELKELRLPSPDLRDEFYESLPEFSPSKRLLLYLGEPCEVVSYDSVVRNQDRIRGSKLRNSKTHQAVAIQEHPKRFRGMVDVLFPTRLGNEG